MAEFQDFDATLGYSNNVDHEEIPCWCSGLAVYCIRHQVYSYPVVTLHLERTSGQSLTCWILLYNTKSTTFSSYINLKHIDIKKFIY